MMLSDLNASCSRSALHRCIVGKVSRTAEVRRQIEFVVVIFFFSAVTLPQNLSLFSPREQQIPSQNKPFIQRHGSEEELTNALQLTRPIILCTDEFLQ